MFVFKVMQWNVPLNRAEHKFTEKRNQLYERQYLENKSRMYKNDTPLSPAPRRPACLLPRPEWSTASSQQLHPPEAQRWCRLFHPGRGRVRSSSHCMRSPGGEGPRRRQASLRRENPRLPLLPAAGPALVLGQGWAACLHGCKTLLRTPLAQGRDSPAEMAPSQPLPLVWSALQPVRVTLISFLLQFSFSLNVWF